MLGTNPAYSGQKFVPAMLNKIERLAAALQRIGSTKMIQVDGGMTVDTLPLAFRAGARCFVAGNAVFKHSEGILGGVRALRQSILSS